MDSPNRKLTADITSAWFPLVPRPRPACLPLEARVARVRDLAHLAAQDTNESLARAAEAQNLAALIMSDCGLPDRARTLCRQQARVFLTARSLATATAKLALEPLVNLARLLIRDGDGNGAYHLLDSLFKAIKCRSDVVIDGMKVGFGDLIRDDDHREVVQWMWTVLLADGTRALTSAGRWQDALAHLQRHKGIGQRMLDGRQVAVIASTTAGDVNDALTLLRDTVPGESWENAVTACLIVLCRSYAHQPMGQDLTVMLERYRQHAPAPGLAVFDTRLGLSVIDAAGGVRHPGVQDIAAALIHRTVASRDGYAAREVLAHDGCVAMLTGNQVRELTEVLDVCALGHGSLPSGLMADLSAAVDTSEAVLSRVLTAAVGGDVVARDNSSAGTLEGQSGGRTVDQRA